MGIVLVFFFSSVQAARPPQESPHVEASFVESMRKSSLVDMCGGEPCEPPKQCVEEVCQERDDQIDQAQRVAETHLLSQKNDKGKEHPDSVLTDNILDPDQLKLELHKTQALTDQLRKERMAKEMAVRSQDLTTNVKAKELNGLRDEDVKTDINDPKLNGLRNEDLTTNVKAKGLNDLRDEDLTTAVNDPKLNGLRDEDLTTNVKAKGLNGLRDEDLKTDVNDLKLNGLRNEDELVKQQATPVKHVAKTDAGLSVNQAIDTEDGVIAPGLTHKTNLDGAKLVDKLPSHDNSVERITNVDAVDKLTRLEDIHEGKNSMTGHTASNTKSTGARPVALTRPDSSTQTNTVDAVDSVEPLNDDAENTNSMTGHQVRRSKPVLASTDIIQQSGFRDAVLKQENLRQLVSDLDAFTTEAQRNAQTVHNSLDTYHRSVQKIDKPLRDVHSDSFHVGGILRDEFESLEAKRVEDFGDVDSELLKMAADEKSMEYRIG